MRNAESPPTVGVRKQLVSPWLGGAIGFTLLAGAAVLDITKPFDKSWSIFYLLPTLYAGAVLRARLEVAVHLAVALTVFLAPLIFRPDLLWAGTGVYNRAFGVILGALVAFLLRIRTAALNSANELLRQEIIEREKAEADRERLEEQLREALKMEAVGRLAGGVAHDFNNLLTVINGQTALLLDEVPKESPWFGSLQAIHKAGGRATEVTHQLLAFGRKQLLQPKAVNVNHAIETVSDLLRQLLPENIRISLDLSTAVQPIFADPAQFAQVLLNLASNARDAMPEGGEFQIKTEPVLVTGKEMVPLSDLKPGPHVRLTVSDTGRGMDEATSPRAFDPFFTTKDVGRGTGLGLASAYGIVRQSHGHIDLASAPGQGTTFRIIWPCAIGDEDTPT